MKVSQAYRTALYNNGKLMHSLCEKFNLSPTQIKDGSFGENPNPILLQTETLQLTSDLTGIEVDKLTED